MNKNLLFGMVLLIAFMSSIDALLTLKAIESTSFSEVNPIMGFVLDRFGLLVFIYTKLALTFIPCIGFVFVSIKQCTLLVILLVTTAFLLYLGLMFYWLVLIYKFGIDFSGAL